MAEETAEEVKEELIFGLWSREEFADDVVFIAFAGLIGILTAFGYKFISKWLAQHKWFKKE